MKDIQNEEWLDSLTDDLRKNLSDLNAYVISVICQRVGFIAQSVKDGKTDLKTATEYAAEDIAKIKKEIEKTKKYSQKEINSIFNKVAAANVDFANDFYTYRAMPNIEDYNQNPDLKPIVDDLKKEQEQGVKNLSKTTTIGFTDKHGDFKPVREKYIQVINEAIEAVRLGEQNFYTTVRPMVKELTNSGLRRAEFSNEGKKPYSRRIDSQIEMNVRDGIRELNSRMQEQVGKEFGADGVEISAHGLCAPDHQDIQGRQYSKEEFEELESQLERKIGEMNCKHFVTPIIIGVSKPVYSEKELRDIKERSNAKVAYKDKEYTRYEASQVQRRYELKIRDARTALKAAEGTGDEEQIAREKTRLRILLADYNRFSKEVGLTKKMERTK